MARVPGGVAGWLAGRHRPAPAPAAPGAVKPVGDSRTTKERAPSQYTLGRRLRDTEQAMAKAQREVDRLHERLAAASDHQELATIGHDLAAAQATLTELEERWLELAEQQ